MALLIYRPYFPIIAIPHPNHFTRPNIIFGANITGLLACLPDQIDVDQTAVPQVMQCRSCFLASVPHCGQSRHEVGSVDSPQLGQ